MTDEELEAIRERDGSCDPFCWEQVDRRALLAEVDRLRAELAYAQRALDAERERARLRTELAEARKALGWDE